jgi:hypothetical protein
MQFRSSQIVFATLIAAGMLLALAWHFGLFAPTYRPADSKAALVSRLAEISGPGAIDCGTAPPLTPNIRNCIRSGLEQDSAFRFIEHLQGIDDLIVIGTAGDPHGRVWQISYAEFAMRPRKELPRFQPRQCSQPAIVGARFSCNGL